jgi:hypothetical protein
MNEYIITAASLRLRKTPSVTAPTVARLSRNTKVYGVELPEDKSGRTWVEAVNGYYFCLFDRDQRYAELVPQRAPVSPQKPDEGAADMSDIVRRIEVIEARLGIGRE